MIVRGHQCRLLPATKQTRNFPFQLLLLLLLCIGKGHGYTFLPLPASSRAAARSWGKLRTEILGTGRKASATLPFRDPGAPNTHHDKKQPMILHSATAPSPPTTQAAPSETEEGVEMFMDELGKIDEAMMVRAWR